MPASSPHLCIQCKHFIPNPDFLSEADRNEHGRCGARVLSEYSGLALVDGRQLTHRAHPYAAIMRNPHGECGPDAKLFIAEES